MTIGPRDPDRYDRNDSDNRSFSGYDNDKGNDNGTTDWYDENGDLDSTSSTPYDEDDD